MSNPKKIDVRCTCCDATLTVDAASGAVLFTKQPEKKSMSFEDALLQVKRQQATAGDRFDQAFEKEKGRKDLIDAKFREAMERADELEMPTRDIDLD
jgi:hypothetical protein